MAVSVIIPVFNAMPFIKQAVASALEQAEISELIIVDDGSTDGSYEYLVKLAKQYRKIKLFIHHLHANKGISTSRNLGVQMAKYPYVAFLDADDYFLKDRFKYSLPYLENQLNCIATVESTAVIKDKEINPKVLSTTQIPKKYHPKELFKIYTMSKTLHFSLNGITIRRSSFDDIGFFDPSLQRSEDTDFVYRLTLTQKLHIPQVEHIVAKYRRGNPNPFRNKTNIRENKKMLYAKWYQLMLKNNWQKEINHRFTKMYIYHSMPYPQCEKKINRYLTTAAFLLKNPACWKKLL